MKLVDKFFETFPECDKRPISTEEHNEPGKQAPVESTSIVRAGFEHLRDLLIGPKP